MANQLSARHWRDGRFLRLHSANDTPAILLLTLLFSRLHWQR